MIYANANYSYSGRRRKKSKPKGQPCAKYQKPAFQTLEAPLYTHRSSGDQYTSVPETHSNTPHQTVHKYTGERRLIGIATMHKSNAVPVFDKEAAVEIAQMRRS
jgi:hypothetical protein